MALAVGTRLGAYEVIGLLGSGGMGDVYRAHDPRLGREVAIKTVRTGAAVDARAALWREARAAASLNHPSICQVYDVGELDDDIYIVMELLRGRSLASRLLDGPMPVAEAVSVGLAVLGALDALHRRDLVHRDVKPSNIFLLDDGVKLLDFGMTRSFAAAGLDDATRTLTIAGTPRYMAPEQWAGTPPDRRTDLFATGLVLFEMLTGRPAFPGDQLTEIYHAVMTRPPAPLGGSGAIVAVDGVIHRALERRPQDRFETADAMAQALRAAVTGGETATAVVRQATRLAVLPFRMQRPDPDLELLSFGLPDAIVSELAGLPSLIVRSPLAAAKHGGDSVDLGAIADALAVDAVVTGTLVRAGGQVRVSAQMLEVPSGTILCSRTVQQAVTDIFAIQDQLAEAIADALATSVTAGQRTVLRHHHPASSRAYELYLRANHVSYDTSMLPVAEQLYRSALADDPQYAPAWARLGRVYRLLAKYGGDDEADAYLQRAAEAFTRAMTLDTDSTVAHNLYTAFEVESEGRAVDATVRLIGRLRDRPDPELFAGLVLSCRFCGLLDASVAADRQARRLDPAIRTSIMYTHFARGDWEQAIATDVEDARWVTKYALLVLGRPDEAMASFRETENRPLPVLLRRLMMVSRLALEGRRDECVAASRAFTGGRAFDPEGLYFAARALAHIGESALALAALEQVVERGYSCVSLLVRDPWLDSIRTDAGFAALIARAEAQSLEASAAFRRAGGDRLLGLPS